MPDDLDHRIRSLAGMLRCFTDRDLEDIGGSLAVRLADTVRGGGKLSEYGESKRLMIEDAIRDLQLEVLAMDAADRLAN